MNHESYGICFLCWPNTLFRNRNRVENIQASQGTRAILLVLVCIRLKGKNMSIILLTSSTVYYDAKNRGSEWFIIFFSNQSLFQDFINASEWPLIIDECDPEYEPTDGELHGLRNIHVFGLANVLKRPIILLDSLAGMQSSGDYSGKKCRFGFIPIWVEEDNTFELMLLKF